MNFLTITLGNYANHEEMGLDIKSVNLNYVIYVLAIFMLPLLVINIFMGITIDELRRMIEASHNQIVRLQAEYALKFNDVFSFKIFSLKNWVKSLYKKFKKIFDDIIKFICKGKDNFFKINKTGKDRDEWKEMMEKYMLEVVQRVGDIEDRVKRTHHDLSEKISRDIEMNRKKTIEIARDIEMIKKETEKIASKITTS